MQDVYVPLHRIAPPFLGLGDAQIAALSRNMFKPLDVPGERQFLLSLSRGTLLDRPRFLALLKGDMHAAATASNERVQRQT